MKLLGADVPLPLGSHLTALRAALIRPLIVLVLGMIAGFIYQVELKELILRPLWKAIALAGPETVRQIGLPTQRGDEMVLHVIALPAAASATAPVALVPVDGAWRLALPPGVAASAALVALPGGGNRLLHTLEMAESTTSALKIALIAGLFLAVPYLLFNLWRFVAIGLTLRERRAAFLFLPAGILAFYGGCIVGFEFGLPWFYKFLIDFQAMDTTALYHLRQSEYVSTFLMWTIAFGLICDIPWAVMVLVRVGLVTPERLAGWRRYVVLANLIAAAMITPTGDPISLAAMFVPMHLCFELGLLLSRLVRPRRPPVELLPPSA